MTDVVIAVTAVAQIEQFSGPKNPAGIEPRARIIFRDGAAIAAKSALDTQIIRLQMPLPPNYAYAWDNLFQTVYSQNAFTDASHMADLGNGALQMEAASTAEQILFQTKSEGDSLYSDNVSAAKYWTAINLPKGLVYNQNGVSPTAWTYLFDDDATNATGAWTFQYTASFLQYDIEQVLNAGVNSPTPVVVR